MRIRLMIGALSATLLVAGCVGKGTHTDTLAELDTARKMSAKTAAVLEEAKKDAAVRIEALEEEKTKLAQELAAEQQAGSRTSQALVSSNESLAQALQGKRQLDEEAKKLREEGQQADRLYGEARRERDLLRTKVDDLDRRISAAQQEAASASSGLAEAQIRVTALEKENAQLAAGIMEAKSQARDLQTRLQAEQGKVASLQEDKQKLLSGTTTAQDEISHLQKRAGELETDAARVKDLEKRLSERDQEVGTLRQTAADRAAMAAKLEQERAAKEAEIQRLTKTHDDLAKSLQDEIAKGDIKLKQVRDRLTINMVDRVLFDSGQAQVKPAGLKVLKQVSDVLKKLSDKQIRIEGHTDNVPIGVKLREKFPTNWELSTARATSVVRYLIEEGGVDRTMMAAGGYADTQPQEGNETEAGKAANRRIEIVLYPKDLGGIAGQMK
ncbi:MAG: OmpA family protein [Nitrospirota bacterium]|nr:OmpA family protein [Nitrospirota bacterium]